MINNSIGKLTVLENNKKISVAAHLNDADYKMLLETYADHNRSMAMERRGNFTLSHIVKVEKNEKTNCLDVHYESGDWWHYKDHQWY